MGVVDYVWTILHLTTTVHTAAATVGRPGACVLFGLWMKRRCCAVNRNCAIGRVRGSTSRIIQRTPTPTRSMPVQTALQRCTVQAVTSGAWRQLAAAGTAPLQWSIKRLVGRSAGWPARTCCWADTDISRYDWFYSCWHQQQQQRRRRRTVACLDKDVADRQTPVAALAAP